MTHTHEYQSHWNKVKVTFLYALLWLAVAIFISALGLTKYGGDWFYIALGIVLLGLAMYKTYRGWKAWQNFKQWQNSTGKS